MNWKQRLTYDPYKKLWSLIGKRPWTYIYRDLWHKYEWFPQIQWLMTGVFIYYAAEHWLHDVWWHVVLIAIAVYTFGYINGHFFWGTRYKANQKVDPKKVIPPREELFDDPLGGNLQ